MFCTQDDILEQLDEAVLIQLTDDADVGMVDADMVTRAIADADAVIDSYVGTRFEVPMSPVPDVIRGHSVRLAICNLYARRRGVPDDRKERCKEAIAFLKDVSAGKAILGAATAPTTTSDTVDIESNTRIFDRDKLTGF